MEAKKNISIKLMVLLHKVVYNGARMKLEKLKAELLSSIQHLFSIPANEGIIHEPIFSLNICFFPFFSKESILEKNRAR